MRAAIYGRQQREDIIPYVEKLFNELKKHGYDICVHDPFLNFIRQKTQKSYKYDTFTSHSDIRHGVELMFSVGGDGTMLDTITLIQDSAIPVAGINTGRLGFLSGIAKDQLAEAVQELVKGNYSLDKRTMLRLESNANLFGGVNYALNELTVHKKDSASMMTINTFLNGEYLNSYWADGLIVATPTGSTGYSLSCGGPIIMPQCENFVITPIAPHNLNVRPIVVSDKNVISLEVEGRNRYFLASLDSRSVTIDSSVQLAVRIEDFKINLVRLHNENFLTTLRDKLMWGVDSRNY
ncbi:MAG: NAD kinase [Bacteroidia bacterium]